MELKHYAAVLWRWRALLALATIIAAGLGYWRSSQTPPVYRTTVTVIVGQFLSTPNPGPGDLRIGEELALSYVQLVHHQPVLQSTIEALGLDTRWDDLAERVAAAHVVGTPLLDLTVTDTDPQRVKRLADEIARQLVLQVPAPFGSEQDHYREFSRQQLAALQGRIQDAEAQVNELQNQIGQEPSGQSTQAIEGKIEMLQGRLTGWRNNYASLLDFFKNIDPANSVRILEPAALPTKPVAPVLLLDVALAAISGLILASLAAFVLDYLDDTLKTSEDVSRVLNRSTLGTIARLPNVAPQSNQLVTVEDPLSSMAESYRVLRTNVQFSSLGVPDKRSLRLLVTSAVMQEGKTLTACNLAVTMAQAGKRVILCDTDLRHPTVHRLFGFPNRIGLTTLLLDDDLPMEMAMLDGPVDGLKVLPSGPLPPNPAELLESDLMESRLRRMRETADVVIFDSPAVLGPADATVLATRCDGLVLVVHAGRTRTDLVKRCKTVLDHVGANMLGVVLNGAASEARPYYSSYITGGSRPWWRASAPWNSLFGVLR
jgi:succinoglycan biosynthesis transport protein ExoP